MYGTNGTTRHTAGPTAAPLRYAAVAATLIAGFLGLLAAVAHPVPAAEALSGVVGAAVSRLRRRPGPRRFAGETSGEAAGGIGEDATDPSAV